MRSEPVGEEGAQRLRLLVGERVSGVIEWTTTWPTPISIQAR